VTRWFVLLPLCFCAFGCVVAEKQLVNQSNSEAALVFTDAEVEILKRSITDTKGAGEMPGIQSVIIKDAGESEGQYSEKEPPGSCKGYALTLEEIREFLVQADVFEMRYDFLPESRCWTKLELTLQNGEKAPMRIERSRRAFIHIPFNNGGTKTVFLYCSKCNSSKFYDAVPIPINAEAEALRRSIEKSVLEEVASGKFKSIEINNGGKWDASTHTFESEASCKSFDLTETDVLNFFQKAQLWTEDTNKLIKSFKPKPSRCFINGKVELQNGTTISWNIDKARNGYLEFPRDPGAHVNHIMYFFCDKCVDDKYYPLKWDNSDTRPILKSVEIEKNAVLNPYFTSYISDSYKPEAIEECKKYRLAKADVIEFFNVARAASESEYRYVEDSPFYCTTSGVAVSDGKKTKWLIMSNRYGALLNEDGTISQHYYCHDCNPKVFEDDCDFACEMSGGEE